MLDDRHVQSRGLDASFSAWLKDVLRAPGEAVTGRIDAMKMTALGAWATDELGRHGAHAVEVSWTRGNPEVEVSASFFGEGMFTAHAAEGHRRSASVMSAVSQIIDDHASALRLLPAVEPWWQVLGVDPGATKLEVDGAYRKQAMLAHPDRGGSADAMARLSTARAEANRTIH